MLSTGTFGIFGIIGLFSLMLVGLLGSRNIQLNMPYCDGVIDHKESFLYNISEAHVSCMFHEEHWLVLMKNRTIGVMLVRQYDAAWGSRHCRSDRLACENGIVFPSMLLIHHGFEHIGWN